MQNKAIKLANEMGMTNSHPDYPHEDWREEVANENTIEGYWSWVIIKMQQDSSPWLNDDD